MTGCPSTVGEFCARRLIKWDFPLVAERGEFIGGVADSGKSAACSTTERLIVASASARRSRVLTMDQARRMASNFAKLRGFKLPNPRLKIA